MHYNENADRDDLVDDEGTQKIAVMFPKAKKGEYSIRKLKLEDATYDYVSDLMLELFDKYEEDPAALRDYLTDAFLDKPDALAAAYDHPSAEEARALHFKILWYYRVKFRAYGGTGSKPGIHLDSVSLTPGRCDLSGYYAKLNTTVSSGENRSTLTTPYISRTEENKLDCLRFRYVLGANMSRLAVSVQLMGNDEIFTLWEDSVQTSNQAEMYGDTPINVSAAYRIIFTGEKSGRNDEEVAVDTVELRRSQDAHTCPFSPDGTATNTSSTDIPIPVSSNSPATDCVLPEESTSLTVSPTGNHSPATATATSSAGDHSSINPTTASSTASIPSQSSEFVNTTSTAAYPAGTSNDPSDEPANDEASNIGPAAGGAVAAVVVVVAVGVVLVIVCRKRRLKSAQNKDSGDTKEIPEIKKGAEKNSDSAYSEIRASHFMMSSTTDGDYADIDGVTSRTSDDTNPYDLAEDGTPGKARCKSGGGDYNHISLRGAPNQNPLKSVETIEDEYNHIDSPQTTPQPDVSAMYSQVQKKGHKTDQSTPKDVYSVVDKTGKKSTQQTPDVYSVVNKGKKPKQQEGDYNRLNITGNQEKKSEDRLSDPYDNPSTLPSSPTRADSEGTKTTPDSGSVPDDYNTLNFDSSHKDSAGSEKRGTTSAAYDHVQNEPDDAYSKTQTGKRNVVIDSDYSHVN